MTRVSGVHLRRRLPVAVLLIVSSPLWVGCSESEYDQCADRATQDWEDYRHDLIDAGNTDASVKELYLEQEAWIQDACGVDPDYQ